MSREGPAPGGIYSDDGLRLIGHQSPDGNISPVIHAFRSIPSDSELASQFQNASAESPIFFASGTDIGSFDGISSYKLKKENDAVVNAISASVIAAYQAAVVANGGALQNTDVAALIVPLSKLINSSVWTKLIDLWVPLGDGILAAQCKIKTGVVSAGVPDYVMANTGFVDADYTVYKGLTGGGNGSGGGTAKELTTGMNFSSYVGNWGFGVFETSRFVSNTDGGLAGDGGANSALSYSGILASKIDGSGLLGDSNNPHSHRAGLIWAQTSGANAYAGCGGYAAVSIAKGNSITTSLKLMSNGGGYYTSASAGGYAAWSPALTSTELALLLDFFTTVSYNLGRLYWKPSIVWVGDSNTAGYDESNTGTPFTDRFSLRVSNALGMPERNKGIAGSAMSSTAGAGTSTKWANQPFSATADADPMMMLCLGTNDAGFNSDLSTLANEYPAFVAKQLQLGFKRENIYLMTPPYAQPYGTSGITDGKLQTINGIVRAAATSYGTKFVDLYAATYNAGNGYFQNTNGWKIHLTTGNSGGHASAANAILAAVGIG